MLTVDDLKEQLREQGVEELAQVKRCYLESDGRLSVIRQEPSDDKRVERKEGLT
jgi:uncharacterized membrane protein YcaP (DUF421 family)